MVKMPKGRPTAIQPQQETPVVFPPRACPDALLRVRPVTDDSIDVEDEVTAALVVNRIRLLSDGQIVGWVPAEANPAIAQCLELGVRYKGTVMSVDEAGAEIRLEAVG